MLYRESSWATRSNYVQRELFSQFSCAFKALQAKEQVLMQKLTQAEVKQHQYLTLMRIWTPYIQQRLLRHQLRRLQNLDLSAFAEALIDVKRHGRLKLPNVWDIISKYSLIAQLVSRIIRYLPCTQVSIESMFSHLKLVLRENRVRMSNELTDAIVFTWINKSV